MPKLLSSAAVMARRTEGAGFDDYPTSPWAVRALVEHIAGPGGGSEISDLTAWEPACNGGQMAAVLEGSFRSVEQSDVHYCAIGARTVDFLAGKEQLDPPPNWIIANPP